MKEEKNRQVAKISVLITSIFVIFISVAYAFLNETLTGTKRQVIRAGNLELEFKEADAITLENALPMYDEVGMIQKPYDFTLTNKMTKSTDYTLRLSDVTEEDKDKLNTILVRYALTKNGTIENGFLSHLTDNIIDSGTLAGKGTIDYSLRLWIDSYVDDENLIKGKTLSYKIEVEANQPVQYISPTTVSSIFDEGINLGKECKTYDDEIDTFLVGQCQNNYVWYSGKLWKVVLRNNETGAVKMITDNNITTIIYNKIDEAAYENSYIDQWLNQEFIQTLHDYREYLVVDSIWDGTSNSSDTPSRPTGETSVQRAVGLLNSYEYYTTYNNSDNLATSETGYLRNGTYWFLSTPVTDTNIRYVYPSGALYSNGSSASGGVRPSVNLKRDIHIVSGDGTKQNPYLLAGDKPETINGETLSTRYSGEYITFNNELYRIVEVEDTKTKITAVDTPEELTRKKFHNEKGITNYEESSIKVDLETYYQNHVGEPYKSMVETNQTWYLGTVGIGKSYKQSICETYDINMDTRSCKKTDKIATASIGLPRIGEMFASQITRGETYYLWTLTPLSNTYINSINFYGSFYYQDPVHTYEARPLMYLKPSVKIKRTNTGNGTYEHPYDIELGE